MSREDRHQLGVERVRLGDVAVEHRPRDLVARAGAGSAGTRRRRSAACSSSLSSACAAGSWSKTCSMSAFLLPRMNSTARYCQDWKPEELPRKPRNSAYSVGVRVASTDHCSVSVRWMCLTRATPLQGGLQLVGAQQVAGGRAARAAPASATARWSGAG